MKAKTVFIVALCILIFAFLVVLIGVAVWSNTSKIQTEAPTPLVINFEECKNAGYPIIESYPRQCRTSDEQVFIEEVGNSIEKKDLIRLFSPQANEVIRSPLEITGEARGTWFFEATFPVVLTNWDGLIISEWYAEAQSDWMSENFVPFKAVLNFDTPTGSNPRGFLILKKDNPSALPEHDDALEIPIRFDLLQTTKQTSDGCVITGCSRQVCANEEVVTTCEYRKDFECYKSARCERQEDGMCGWTLSEDLTECLSSKRNGGFELKVE